MLRCHRMHLGTMRRGADSRKPRVGSEVSPQPSFSDTEKLHTYGRMSTSTVASQMMRLCDLAAWWRCGRGVK